MSSATDDIAAASPDPEIAFYRHVLRSLQAAEVPVLVGGAYAFARYTGIERSTKDLDLFLRREDFDRAAMVLGGAGYDVSLTYPHWLGKARHEQWFVDLIFNSGNGVVPVDDEWLTLAVPADVLGVPTRMTPAEETLWSKAFVMERERYDGADVAHLLRALARSLDWPRLLRRFGTNWRVLLSHLVLFGFVYPDRREDVPAWVMEQLLDRLRDERDRPAPRERVCRGTLLSREQYLHDVHGEGYVDARQAPHGTMSADDLASWTDAIDRAGSGTSA